jgi:hypothetical protein
MGRGLRSTRSLFFWNICIDCVFVCICICICICFYFICGVSFYISLLVLYIWELMRGKRDSPHQAGAFTRGEGIREFVMATIQYDYKQTYEILLSYLIENLY